MRDWPEKRAGLRRLTRSHGSLDKVRETSWPAGTSYQLPALFCGRSFGVGGHEKSYPKPFKA